MNCLTPQCTQKQRKAGDGICSKCNRSNIQRRKRAEDPNFVEYQRAACNKYASKNRLILNKKAADRYQKNKEALKEKARVYRKNNPLKTKETYTKSRNEPNRKEKTLVRQRQYKKDNPDIVKISNRSRDALRRAGIPRKLNKEIRLELRQIYKGCPIGLQVDHIIPLVNSKVCGLHVPWNLQYLNSSENGLKSNKFDGTVDNNNWRKE